MKLARIHRSVLALTVAGTAWLAAACTVDSDNASGDRPDSAENVVDTIEPDETLADKLPPEYRDSINVGMSFTFPPMRYMDGDQRVGAEYDLARAVAKTLDTEMEVTVVSFDGLVPALDSQRIDVAVESFADLPERRKQVSFVDYYRSATTLEVAEGNPEEIDGLDSMCGHSIAIQQGVESVQRAKTQNKACRAEGEEPIDINLYESSNDATLAVINGRADATANDYPAALHETETIKDGKALDLIDKPISSDYLYGFATRKDEEQLQIALRDALQNLMDSGRYKKILDAYGVGKGAIEKTGINIGPAKD